MAATWSIMGDYTRLVKKILSDNGCKFVRYGKGDHEVWHNPLLNKTFSNDGKIRKRTSANENIQAA